MIIDTDLGILKGSKLINIYLKRSNEVHFINFTQFFNSDE